MEIEIITPLSDHNKNRYVVRSYDELEDVKSNIQLDKNIIVYCFREKPVLKITRDVVDKKLVLVYDGEDKLIYKEHEEEKYYDFIVKKLCSIDYMFKEAKEKSDAKTRLFFIMYFLVFAILVIASILGSIL